MKFTQPIVILASLAFAATALCAPISSEATLARRSAEKPNLIDSLMPQSWISAFATSSKSSMQP